MFNKTQITLRLTYDSAAGLDTCFHLLWLSTKHHVRVSINAPGWGVSQPKSVYTSPAETRLLLSRRERWIFNNGEVILTLVIHWLRPPLFLLWCSEATLAI